MAKFWKDLPRAASVENSDKVMIGNDADGMTCYADVSTVTAEVTNEINRVRQTVANLDGAKAAVAKKYIETQQDLYAIQTPGLYGVKLSSANAIGGNMLGSLVVSAAADQAQAFTQLFIAANDTTASDIYTRVVKTGEYQVTAWTRLLTERDLNNMGQISSISKLNDVKSIGEYYGTIFDNKKLTGESFRLIVVHELRMPNRYRQFLFMYTGITTRTCVNDIWGPWSAYETTDKLEQSFPLWLKKIDFVEIGNGAFSNPEMSIAIGIEAKASAPACLAIGIGAYAEGDGGNIVVGSASTNMMTGAVVLGNGVEALADYEWVNSLNNRFVMRTRFINEVTKLQIVTDRQGQQRLAYVFEAGGYKQLKVTGSCYIPVVVTGNVDLDLKGKIDAVAVWNFETPANTLVSPRAEGDLNWSADLLLGHLYLTPSNFEIINFKNGEIYFVIQLFE